MNQHIARTLIVAALAAATFAPAAALAQSRPLPQQVLSRGLPDRTHSDGTTHQSLAMRNDRTLYARIDAIHADVLLVRSRSGREVRVDASDALKAGTYSAPLFIGKLVLVTGYYDGARTLHAQSVMREPHIDARTPADR